MVDLDKYSAILSKYDDFIDIQMRKFADNLPTRRHEPWPQIKDRLAQNADFRPNYANDKNFQEYLIEEKVVGNEKIEVNIPARYQGKYRKISGHRNAVCCRSPSDREYKKSPELGL